MVQRIIRAWDGFQFEIAWALVFLFLGIPLATGLVAPNSTSALLPTPLRVAWGIALALGGLLVLYGIIWRYFNEQQFIAGLYVERAGLWILSSGIFVLAISIWIYARAPGFFFAAIYAAVVGACLSRIRAITKEIGLIRGHG